MARTLDMWTIYYRPRDFPGQQFVARKFEIGQGKEPTVTSEVMTSADIDALRNQFIRMGKTVLTRSEDDDPVIVETWF